MRLEAIQPADYDAVEKLWRESDGVGLRADETRHWLARYLERNPGMSWLARDGSDVIGAVLGGHDGRRGYLYHLAIAASHRRRGIARALVAASLEVMAKHGIVRATVFVYDDNAAALDFWRTSGWHDRVDLRMMQKSVT